MRVDLVLLVVLAALYATGVGVSATYIDRWLCAELPPRWRSAWLASLLALAWLALYLVVMALEWRDHRPRAHAHAHARTQSGVDALGVEEASPREDGTP